VVRQVDLHRQDVTFPLLRILYYPEAESGDSWESGDTYYDGARSLWIRQLIEFIGRRLVRRCSLPMRWSIELMARRLAKGKSEEGEPHHRVSCWKFLLLAHLLLCR
jgi:hypothetical protein